MEPSKGREVGLHEMSWALGCTQKLGSQAALPSVGRATASLRLCEVSYLCFLPIVGEVV